MSIVSRIVSMFILSHLLNVPLMACVERVYDDYIKIIEERRLRNKTESDIIEAKRSLYLRNNYDAIIISIADLILMERINASDLELIWWRAKDSRIRIFVLITYLKKYGNKRVSQHADFESYTLEFSDENKHARLKEIESVYQLLNVTQKENYRHSDKK